jgi:hypothetical protein
MVGASTRGYDNALHPLAPERRGIDGIPLAASDEPALRK